MDRVLSVAEDLNLDMTGARDEALEVKTAVPERGERLGARLRESALSSSTGVSATRIPRPPPPAAALIISG